MVAVSFRLHWLAELTKRTWPFFLTQAVIVPLELGLSVARATVPRADSANPAATPTSRRGRRRAVSGRERTVGYSPHGQILCLRAPGPTACRAAAFYRGIFTKVKRSKRNLSAQPGSNGIPRAYEYFGSLQDLLGPAVRDVDPHAGMRRGPEIPALDVARADLGDRLDGGGAGSIRHPDRRLTRRRITEPDLRAAAA